MQLGMKGRTAVVTGGASGIGLACAREMAAEGCHVAIWDYSEAAFAAAEQIAEEFSVPAVGVKADVSEFLTVEKAVCETEARLGPVAALVHSAAVSSGKFGFPFTNLRPDDWRRVLEVNVMGMVHVAHAVAPGMRSRRLGTIAFIGSVAGQIGSSTDPPYSAGKAANINFAQCMARDLAPFGVRVNIVNPGMVQTPLNRSVWQAWSQQQSLDEQLTYDDWARKKIESVVPLRRWQSPEDIAAMVTFLCSDRAAQITGQTINVDGGQVMHW